METVKEVMTLNPVYCLPATTLKAVSQLMVKHNCGEIPVLYSDTIKKVVGVITDRDICSRSIARGLNPFELTVEDCMTTPAKIIKSDMSIEDCCDLMKEEQIRRLPVVDENERLCGMITFGDIIRKTNKFRMVPMLENIFAPPRVLH